MIVKRGNLMVIHFQGAKVSVPTPSSDGAKEFDIPPRLWELWKEKKHICKAHGFYIERRGDKWVGIYRPFAIFAEGTKRLEDEKSKQAHLPRDLFVPEMFDIGF